MIQFSFIVAYIVLTGLVMSALWKYRQASPIFWFPASLLLMAIGTFALVDPRLVADRTYVAMFFVAQISVFAGVMLVVTMTKLGAAFDGFAERPEIPNSMEERYLTVAIFVLSTLITIGYYYAVGYNMFFLLITGNLDGDYSEMRLAMYSGDTYFAPGYVNQFKNVLLPLSAVVIAMWLRQSRYQLLFYGFSAVATAITVIALLGTGQRAYILYSFVAVLFGIILHNSGRVRRGTTAKILIALFPIALLFGFMTGAYKDITAGGPESLLATALQRFTSVQQEGALVGFRYIYAFDTVWFSEWWEGLRGLLPNERGSMLAHEIHELMYLDPRGTVPLSSVGSAYYNGGVLGVMLLFSSLGLLYAYLYHRYLSGKRTILRSMTYGSLFFYLSIYVSDAPIGLLDNGALTLIVFLLLAKIRLRSTGSRPMPVTGRVGAGAGG